jgi:hypothetical protein
MSDIQPPLPVIRPLNSRVSNPSRTRLTRFTSLFRAGLGAIISLECGSTNHDAYDQSHVELAGLPCTEVACAAIDAAAWQPWSRFACALVAAVVQQRLCTADELDPAMQHVGRVRHKAHLREAVRDIRGGSQALSEIDLIRVCRRFGIQEPDRQVERFDSHGRLRYLDAEWEIEGWTARGAGGRRRTPP